MIRIIAALAALALLAGCKASNVEVRVSTDDIEKAVAGEDVSVRFIARFESFGTLSAEQRDQLDAIKTIVENAIEVEDYNLVSDASKTTITVEGEMPIVVGRDPGTAPFALHLFEIDNSLLPGFSHVLQLATGSEYQALKAKMQDVSYMLTVDEVHPVQYRIRNESDVALPMLVGGGQIEGTPYNVSAFELAPTDRVSVTYKGGTFDTIFGGVMIGLD